MLKLFNSTKNGIMFIDWRAFLFLHVSLPMLINNLKLN